MGAMMANLARHHDRPFHAIEHIQWPFILVFFLLAGAALELEALPAVGGWAPHTLSLASASACWAFRSAHGGAPCRGARVGGWALHCFPRQASPWVWRSSPLSDSPERADVLLSVVLASTVVFEILGPPMTRLALRRVKEAA